MLKRAAIGLSILALLLLAAPPPAPAQTISQYSKTVSATVTNTVVSFGLNAVEIAVANDGAYTAYASLAGVAVSTDTASMAIGACETGIWTIPTNAAPVTSINIVTAGGQTATVRVAAFTASNYNSPNMIWPKEMIFSKIIHCSFSSANEAVGGNLTVAGTATVTGATTLSSTLGVTGASTIAALSATTGTFSSTLGVTGTTTAAAVNGTTITASAHLNDSSLTASRIVNTDGSKNLVSNTSITTNCLPKSVSSGASLAVSSACDDGTNVTVTEPILANASIQGNYSTFALTSGGAAATFVKVAIPSNSAANLLIEYVFEASTAVPHVQAFGGMIGVSAVNVGGTITCTVGVPTTATQPALAGDGGTLTNAITCADGTAGVLNILATDTSSITPTTNRIRYRVHALAATALVITAQ